MDPPPWILREIERRARNVLNREPTGDVDAYELAMLALDLVTKASLDAPYRGTPSTTSSDADDSLQAMATLERQLSECHAELLAARRELETLRKR